MPVPDGELHRVLYVDGIWVARDLVVLICCSGERVVSWYMARSENSRAWSALMAPIPAPEVVVTDGGSGFAKAVRETWPRTRVQVHLPRLLTGQALHDDAAEAPGGARALPHRARPHGHRDAAPGRALGRALPRPVRVLVTSWRTGPWWTAGGPAPTRG